MTVNSYSYFTTCLTVFESLLDVVGYMPTPQLYLRDEETNSVYVNPTNRVKQVAYTVRHFYGKALLISGLAISILSFAISFLYAKQRTLFERLALRGVEFAIHGALNMGRAELEKRGWGILTLTYDLFQIKCFAYAHVYPSFDIKTRFFTFIQYKLKYIPSNLFQVFRRA